MPILILALLAMPLVEIGGFILVGDWLGLFPTLMLVILSGLVGLVLLRRQGIASIRRMQAEMRAGGVPGAQMFDTVLIGIAGFLLLVPGFASDILGLLLFLPPVRAAIRRGLAKRVVVAGAGPGGMGRGGMVRPGAPHGATTRPVPTVIDLSGEDFRRDGDPNSPWSTRETPQGGEDDTPRPTLH